MPGASTDTRDPYTVLGVSRGASDAEIRAAYLALVARYHPDRHQGNPLADLASARMAEINRAYEELSDRGRERIGEGGAGRSGGAGQPGQPGGDANGAGWTGAPRRDGRRGQSPPPPLAKRLFRGALFLLAFPVLLRLAPRLVRLLAGLGRIAFEGAAAARGTPLVALGVLASIVLLILFIIRRRRNAAPGRSAQRR